MEKRCLLKQIILKGVLVLIAFFSLSVSVDAANFAYNAFDWDTFYKENVDFWTDECLKDSGNVSLEDCLEITLSGKKEYYKSLYKILAKYEKKGYKLNDNYLLVTTFYFLTPDSFSEIPGEYLNDYMTGEAYGLDGDADTYDVDMDLTIEYFQNEKDTLKMLTKHMFSYQARCDKDFGPPQTAEDGTKYCSQGTLKNGRCVEEMEDYKLNYTEYLIEKWGWILKLFGYEAKYRKMCESKGGIYVPATGKKQIDYNTYWRFLEESEYFDDKVHLTNYYASLLKKSGHSLMREMTDDEKELYKDELIEIRKEIVREIRSVLESYGETAPTPNSYIFTTNTSKIAWWPIGSDEVTEQDGVTFAVGSPTSVSISSEFGTRADPFTGETSTHTGVDINGVVEGVTNIIAVKDGVVVYPTSGANTNCPSKSIKDNCGGGYGNYVVIQHGDGTYTLYAHLYPGTITVKANDSVKQGQVIGKAGSSGFSTGPHLHFEVRQGSNTSSSAIDPINYISAENPRPIGSSSASSEFLKMLHYFEGGCNSPRNGNNYVVHDDGYQIPTVGYGVALMYNVENFSKLGVNVSNMTFGDEINIEVVDTVEMMELEGFRTNVNNYLGNAGITLTDYQVDCLVMISYQFGNIGNFSETYKLYGNSEQLRENTHSYSKKGWYYFKHNPSTGNGRAEATWRLFHEGVYTYNEETC